MKRTRRSDSARHGGQKSKEIVPGLGVGAPTPADDDVPRLEVDRRLTTHFFERGRPRPKVALDRSRRRRPADSAQGRRRRKG
jgi:hypothetical protein